MFRRNQYSVLAGLDIGSRNMKIIVVADKGEEDLEVLAQVNKPCFGVRKGVIVKPDKITEEIEDIAEEAETISGQKIESVFLNIDGSHVGSISSKGIVAVSRADGQISQEDIDRVIQAAQKINIPSNKEIIDVFPKEFVIDGEGGIREPIGMKGTRLEAEVLLICALSPYLQNLTKTVLNSGLNINNIQSSPIAAARAVLNPQQKELGVALVDIGASTTGMAVFEEENLIHAAIFPIGSDHITQDIAIGLKCEIDLAEKIKREFGTCILKRKKGEKYKRDKIVVSDSLSFSRKMLTTIVEARVSEIFDLVSKELKKASVHKLLPAGIVLTGGGAKTSNIVELVKKELKLPCKIGFSKGIFGLEKDSSLATVCGLVLETSEHSEEYGYSFTESRSGIGSKIKKIFKIFIP